MSETRNPRSARRVRLGNVPSISVVVASAGPRQRLEAVLGAVREACAGLEAELVVARACDRRELASLRAAHPAVRFVGAPAGRPLDALRAAGMEAARGDVVRMLEDGGALQPGWAEPLAATRSRGTGAERTPSPPARAQPAIDWQAYFSDHRTQSGSSE